MPAESDIPVPALFAHALRADWGLGIFAREMDGKRHYLFEDGRERVLATAFEELMIPVQTPTPEQHAIYAKLCKLLRKGAAKRRK